MLKDMSDADLLRGIKAMTKAIEDHEANPSEETLKAMIETIGEEIIAKAKASAKASREQGPPTFVEVGDAIALVLEQVANSNYKDDHDHPLVNHQRVIELGEMLGRMADCGVKVTLAEIDPEELDKLLASFGKPGSIKREEQAPKEAEAWLYLTEMADWLGEDTYGTFLSGWVKKVKALLRK